MVAERLFVCDGDVDEVTFGPEPLVGKMPDRDRHRRGEVEHVNSTATPDLAVDQLPSERVMPPLGRIGRDDICVPDESERGCARPASFDPGDQRAASGEGFVRLKVKTMALESSLDGLGAPVLVA